MTPVPGDAARARPRWSIRVGRVAGVDIRVHASFLVLVALVVAVARGAGGPSVMSFVVWIVAVFAAVLVHELAHCVVARRKGIAVEGIVLLPIGGISQLERLPTDPRDELQIAAVGPLTSCALGVACLGAAAVSVHGVWPPSVTAGPLLARLGWFNLLVAAFNLVPALPLDGGRILRAWLERTRERDRATATAARLGRWLALLMIAAGVMFDVWLILIGLFVFVGSLAEQAAAEVHERLKAVHVRDVMVEDPIVLSAWMPSEDAHAVLRSTNQRAFPVTSLDGRYVGMVDAAAIDHAPPHLSIGYVATSSAPVALDDLVETTPILEPGIECLAVVAHDRVVGMLRNDDVRRLMLTAPAAVQPRWDERP